MKYDINKSFGYPVLAEYNNDYSACFFKSEYSFDLDSNDSSCFILSYKIQCNEDGLLEAIRIDDAKLWIRISCRSTYYSKMYEVPMEGEISIPGSMVRDKIEILSYIIATKKSRMVSFNINSEFGFNEFETTPGKVLAQGTPNYFITDKEYWKPLSSLFEYVENPLLEYGEFEVSLDDEIVSIQCNKKQYEKFQQFGKSRNGRVVLLNTVFVIAVDKMINALKINFDEYSERKWARVIEAKAASKNVDIKSQNTLIAASRLLNQPLVSLMKEFLDK